MYCQWHIYLGQDRYSNYSINFVFHYILGLIHILSLKLPILALLKVLKLKTTSDKTKTNMLNYL